MCGGGGGVVVWFTLLVLIISYITFFYIRNSSSFYFEIVTFYDILSFHDGALRFCAYYVRNVMFEAGSVPGDALFITLVWKAPPRLTAHTYCNMKEYQSRNFL